MKRLVTLIAMLTLVLAAGAVPAQAITAPTGTYIRPGASTPAVVAKSISSGKVRIVAPKPSVNTTPVPVPTPAKTSRFFGAYIHGAPDSMAPISDFESQVGTRAAVVNFYVALTDGFPVNRTASLKSHGSIPLITLEFWDYTKGVTQPDWTLKSITNGSHDAQIRAFAQGAKASGTTLWIRPLHEMNSNWYPWSGSANGNSPADYVPAWKHIVDVFRAEGATNVQFVWCPNNDSVPNTAANAISAYWPGDAYVDRIALDGYNFGTSFTWSSWRSFTTTFKASYTTVAALSATKPIFIAETASSPVGGNKAAWVADMFKVIPTTFPRLTGVTWFETNAECDWRVAADSGVLGAVKTGLAGF